TRFSRDWSSDVCSSDLLLDDLERGAGDLEERLGLLADLQHRDAHGDGDDEDLQGVEAQRERAVIVRGAGDAQEVRGDQAREEVEPAALGGGGGGGVRGDARVLARGGE